jgi:hypothetical protein
MNNELVSGCCGSEVTQADKNGHGRCKECGENCTSVETV